MGSFVDLLSTHPALYVTWVVAVIVSVVLHELGHGFAAVAQGDRTPIVTGHMTWNPVVHMGGFSLILLAVVGIAYGAMPVQPAHFRSRRGELIVAFAGPAMNLLLATAAVLLAGLSVRLGLLHPPSDPFVRLNSASILLLLAQLNVALFAFNLLPIPPLDGSTVLGDLWPDYRRWTRNPDLQPFFLGAFLFVFLWGGRLFAAATRLTEQAFHVVSGT